MRNDYRERNADLVRRYQSGDRRAGDELLALNVGMIEQLVSRFYPNVVGRMEWEDLEQLGRLGLLHAAEQFEAERGHSFATYAHWWVYQSLQRGIEDTGSLIRIPTHAQQRHRAYLRDPQTGDPKYQTLPVTTHSIDYSTTREGVPPVDELHFLVDDDDFTERVVMRIWLNSLLKHLVPCQRETIIRHLGLDGEGEQTLAEIGREDGTSREGVRQREARALKRLRALVNAEK